MQSFELLQFEGVVAQKKLDVGIVRFRANVDLLFINDELKFHRRS